MNIELQQQLRRLQMTFDALKNQSKDQQTKSNNAMHSPAVSNEATSRRASEVRIGPLSMALTSSMIQLHALHINNLNYP